MIMGGQNMRDELIKIVMTGLASVLTGIAALALKEICYYLSIKRKEVIKRIGAQRYNTLLSAGKAVYYEVEENFKGLSGISDEKMKAFETSITKLIPEITEDEIEHVRQSICGEINNCVKDYGLLGNAEENPYIEAEDAEDLSNSFEKIKRVLKENGISDCMTERVIKTLMDAAA